jgi:hypothetical protein
LFAKWPASCWCFCTVTFAQGSIEDHAKQLANTITALINLPDSELFSVFHIEISGWSIED